MEKEYVVAEFQALRDEIMATQRRDSQLIGISALVIPAINYIIQSRAEALVVPLPLVVVTIVLLHVGNTHSLIRMGRYIRERLEPQFGEGGGWETWLQQRDVLAGETTGRTRRRAEIYMKAAISLIFGVYYCAALWLAFRYVERASVAGAITLLGAYLALGSWLGLHLWRNLPMTTDPQEFEVYAHPPRRGVPRIPILKRDEPKPPTVSP